MDFTTKSTVCVLSGHVNNRLDEYVCDKHILSGRQDWGLSRQSREMDGACGCLNSQTGLKPTAWL
jgi:hypothetical protein